MDRKWWQDRSSDSRLARHSLQAHTEYSKETQQSQSHIKIHARSIVDGPAASHSRLDRYPQPFAGSKTPNRSAQSARTIPRTILCTSHTPSHEPSANKHTLTGRLQEYQVIGRHLPTDANPTPKLYRMRIFATNYIVAKSRFWYFLAKLKKIKKANGEIVTLTEIHEKRPQKVKNFGIWIRYDSRSGTHNMYKEYREMSRADAVNTLYQDMAARHRARFRTIHILKVVEIEKTSDLRRPYMLQLLKKNLKFPLPHRVPRKSAKKVFAAHRPSTFA